MTTPMEPPTGQGGGFCGQCGAARGSDDQFCSVCGAPSIPIVQSSGLPTSAPTTGAASTPASPLAPAGPPSGPPSVPVLPAATSLPASGSNVVTTPKRPIYRNPISLVSAIVVIAVIVGVVLLTGSGSGAQYPQSVQSAFLKAMETGSSHLDSKDATCILHWMEANVPLTQLEKEGQQNNSSEAENQGVRAAESCLLGSSSIFGNSGLGGLGILGNSGSGNSGSGNSGLGNSGSGNSGNSGNSGLGNSGNSGNSGLGNSGNSGNLGLGNSGNSGN
jgi:hypothetical protein